MSAQSVARPPKRAGNSSELRARSLASLGVFSLALLVRGVLLWQLSDGVLFDFVLGDAKNYVARGKVIAAGNWIGDEVFYQAPLYSYFLGVVQTLFGEGTLVVRQVQIVLGACSFLEFLQSSRQTHHVSDFSCWSRVGFLDILPVLQIL